MTNVELVTKILREYPCQSSIQIQTLAYRLYDEKVSVYQVAGALRSLGKQAKISSSNCGNGREVYWLTDSYLAELKES